MKTGIAAGALVALAVGLGQNAAAQTSNGTLAGASTMLPGFTMENIAAIAREVGYQAEAVQYDDGSTDVKITTPKGTFFARATVCQTTVCAGVEIYAFFGNGAATLDQLNDFNQQRSFTKAVSINGTVVLTRYEIADFGIPKGNLASNYTNFAAIATDFDAFLNGASGASAKIESGPGGKGKKNKTVETAYAPAANMSDLAAHWEAMLASGKADPFQN